MTAEELIKSAQEQIESYGNDVVVTAELTSASVMRFIALLQLCSRHPNLSDSDQKFIRIMVERMSNGFKSEHKSIAELIRRGWHQQYDQEFSA